MRTAIVVVGLALTLSACGGGGTGTTSTRDILQFSGTNIPVAYVGEPYGQDLAVAGGVSPYNLRLAAGQLPAGLRLNGLRLEGTPTSAGVGDFTLEVSDASLSTKIQKFSLSVTALPTAIMGVTLPKDSLRGESRIPLNISGARAARAARYQWRLPDGVTVTKVQPGDGQPVVFWKQSGGLLTLDLGFRTPPAQGARVALVSLRPSKPVTLSADPSGFEVQAGDGKSLGKKELPAPPPPAPAPDPKAAPKADPAKPADPKAPADPAKRPTPSPTTQPPVTQPPVTQPPVTQPPVTQPADPAPTNPAPGTPTPENPAPPAPGGK